MATGFSFGGTTTTSAPPFNFGAAAAKTATSGFSFGLNKTAPSTGLLPTPASTAQSGFSFGATAPGATAPGATPGASSFSFGAAAPAAAATTAAAGFSFGAPAATTTASTGLSFGATAATTTTASTGFSFGAPAASTAVSTGFSFAPTTTTTTASLGFGGFGLTASTAATTASTGFGLLGTTPASGGASIFGATTTSTTAAASSIFTSQPAKTTLGLGGVDPNTAAKSGATGNAGTASDGKTVKETVLPDQLAQTVDSLQKYVKEEKQVREDIARISSKPMIKVQEDVTALRQLLSVVANGLQRNACSVEKLKHEMTQNLKNAEMAQRTKDIPAGLQYENSAPIEYFQHLVEEFEDQMMMYRQQIETLDNHLAALHQPNAHSPAEVLTLMKKLHETFLSLAAQLQHVHEAVKSQRDQFLTYRRVFHGDSKNIFQRHTAPPKTIKKLQLSELAGPNPFPNTANAAAQAMAMVHTRAQQPQGPPITSLVGANQPGFGVSPFGAGGGLFGPNKTNAGFGTNSLMGQPSLGSAGNLFSSPALGGSPAVGGFGTPPTLGSSTTAALNLAGTNMNMSANVKQPFQLQKPPQGAKRGKR